MRHSPTMTAELTNLLRETVCHPQLPDVLLFIVRESGREEKVTG